jgi:hypothetical protein
MGSCIRYDKTSIPEGQEGDNYNHHLDVKSWIWKVFKWTIHFILSLGNPKSQYLRNPLWRYRGGKGVFSISISRHSTRILRNPENASPVLILSLLAPGIIEDSKGDEGDVFQIEIGPWKGGLGPFWEFLTISIAARNAQSFLSLFLDGMLYNSWREYL